MATQLSNATADAASRVEATLSARVRVIRPLAALLAVVLALGGCDLLGGDGSGTSGKEADGATLGAVGPPASPEVYRELLATVGTPVSTALAGIAEATSLTALSSRVARAEQVAGQAAERLGQFVPPADSELSMPTWCRPSSACTATWVGCATPWRAVSCAPLPPLWRGSADPTG